MTATRARSLIWVAAITVGIVAGLLIGRGPAAPETTTFGEPAPASLPAEVGITDLIAEVTVPQLFSAEEFRFGVIESFDTEIVKVLYLSDSAAMQADEPEVPYIVPRLTDGDPLVLGSLRQGNASEHRYDDAEGTVLIGATYYPTHRLNGHKTNWIVNYMATEGADGTWTFLNVAGAGMRAQLDQLQSAVTGDHSHTELMVIWARQLETERAGGEVSAYASVFSREPQRDATAGWYELPAAERPLDPELTPGEVLGTLATVQLLVDIESAPQLDDRFIVIKSDTGIVYSTVLSAGNHSVDALAKPGDALRVVVTDHPSRGDDELIATVAAIDWEQARPDTGIDMLSIRYTGLSEAEVRVVDRTIADSLLARWAEDDAREFPIEFEG